jgi:hypothetical protein
MALHVGTAGVDRNRHLIRHRPGGDEGTSVLFTHNGWKTTEESFPFIAYSWAQIPPRLKKLAEEGKADPHFNF